MRIAALFVLLPALAVADDAVVGEEVINVTGTAHAEMISTSGSETRSYRSVSKGWMIVDGQELGGELRFLTAPSFGGAELAFTDVVLLTLRARTALGKRADLFAAVDLLPKQPSTTDELVWQGASLGLNMQPWNKPVALFARGAGGVLLDRGGAWGQLGVGATARKQLHEIMLFEGSASALGTRVRPSGDRMPLVAGSPGEDASWLVETALAGSVLFHDPEGWTGGWFGFEYALPIAHGAMLDPQPRINLELGVVLSFVDNWDVFTRFSVIDRGDAAAPATQLPILDGGFDQRQLVVGVTYHTSEAR